MHTLPLSPQTWVIVALILVHLKTSPLLIGATALGFGALCAWLFSDAASTQVLTALQVHSIALYRTFVVVLNKYSPDYNVSVSPPCGIYAVLQHSDQHLRNQAPTNLDEL